MLTLRYNEPVFILMLRGRVGCLRQGVDKIREYTVYKQLKTGVPPTRTHNNHNYSFMNYENTFNIRRISPKYYTI